MIRYQLFILTHLGPVIAGLSVWVEADAAGGELVSTTCGASGLLRDEDNGVGDKKDGSIPASEWALLALGTPYNTKRHCSHKHFSSFLFKDVFRQSYENFQHLNLHIVYSTEQVSEK